MAPDGRWLAYCQPTRDTNGDGHVDVEFGPRGELGGDTPEVHLYVNGKTELIDELLTFDRKGRHLVFRKGDTAWLLDAVTGKRVDLTPLDPDLRSDEGFDLRHRALSFDEAGKRLLVLRQRGRMRYEADLLALTSAETKGEGNPPTKAEPESASAAEAGTLTDGVLATFKLLPGEIWQAELSSDGQRALFAAILETPGKPQNLQWTLPLRSEPIRRCERSARFSTWPGRGGDVTHQLASAKDPTPRVVPGFVMAFGDGWVRREGDGRLLLVRNGTQKQIASSRCGARVLHADPERGLFLIACEHYRPDGKPEEDEQSSRRRRKKPPKTRFDLYLVAPGYVRDLEADVALTGIDQPPGQAPRLLPIRPGARTVLVDFEKRRTVDRDPNDRVVATHGSKVLVRRGGHLTLFDVDTNRSVELGRSVTPYPEILVRGRYAFVTPYLVDLETERVAQHDGVSPLGLTSGGRLITPAQHASHGEWPVGPLSFTDLPLSKKSH